MLAYNAAADANSVSFDSAIGEGFELGISSTPARSSIGSSRPQGA